MHPINIGALVEVVMVKIAIGDDGARLGASVIVFIAIADAGDVAGGGADRGAVVAP